MCDFSSSVLQQAQAGYVYNTLKAKVMHKM